MKVEVRVVNIGDGGDGRKLEDEQVEQGMAPQQHAQRCPTLPLNLPRCGVGVAGTLATCCWRRSYPSFITKYPRLIEKSPLCLLTRSRSKGMHGDDVCTRWFAKSSTLPCPTLLPIRISCIGARGSHAVLPIMVDNKTPVAPFKATEEEDVASKYVRAIGSSTRDRLSAAKVGESEIKQHLQR